ncbi:MAG: 16S rRNA (cytosine(1402)-N(4))-methyltransferase RsmH [Planctomycetes bacterium]|nr:16S rRNA (cytosine(1402)-N(4))-methyltransferase RsmH [Planctomycetota bacterium]
MRHIPIMPEEVLHVLDPRPGAVVVDCTVGLGGHAGELLRRLGRRGRLLGLDLDPANLSLAGDHLSRVGGRFSLRHANFAALPSVLAEEGIDGADALLADLGLSSPHIDDPRRGFSYRQPGPLDMRMDPTRGEPASTILNRMTEDQLAQALLELGDETDAPAIAQLIVRRRPIRTTQELTALVCEARRFTLRRAAGAKLHPAARTFQALRILVNRELANLERLLTVLPQCLKPGAVAAIITFHSGEDRRVKHAFRDQARAGLYAQIGGPLTAGEEEQRANPRSTAAKLRWAKRAAR